MPWESCLRTCSGLQIPSKRQQARSAEAIRPLSRGGAHMSGDSHPAFDWNISPFDEEVTLAEIPSDTIISAMHLSIKPKPGFGGVRILGRMRDGSTGSVTFFGDVYAAKLPFADRVIRLQYLGNTRSVGVELTSYTH